MTTTPASEDHATHRAAAALMALATLVILGATLRTSVNFVDDALITLTYAKNLVLGNGFVYNAPPATFGTTTPLWTLLTAALGVVFGADALPLIALWLSALCWLGIVWVFFLGWRTWGVGRNGAAFIALLFATSYHPNLGMEQPVFQLLLLALCLLTFQRRFLCAGIAGGLLFLVRGEGALAVLLTGICALYLGGSPRAALTNGLRLSAGFWIIVTPWLLYAWTHFGKILPDTLQSKMQQGLLPGYEQFQHALARALIFEWPAEGLPIPPLHLALVIYGLVAALRASGALRWLLAWTLLYSIAYTALHVADFWWYEIPVYWTWLLCLGVGILNVPCAVARLPLRKPARVGANAVLALALVLTAARIVRQPTGPGVENDVHADLYRPAAAWLDAYAPMDATFGTTEVGYYGYFTQLQIIDQFGLITPEALELDDPHDTLGFLRRFRPDLYAVAHWNDAKEPPPHAAFHALGYRCVARFAGARRTALLFASMRSERLRGNPMMVGPDSDAMRASLDRSAPEFKDLVAYLGLNPAQQQQVLGILRNLREGGGDGARAYDHITTLLTDAQLPRFTYLAPTRIPRIQLGP